MQVGPDLHTGRSPTQPDIYQMLYWYTTIDSPDDEHKVGRNG
jgi:hypothetical protein